MIAVRLSAAEVSLVSVTACEGLTLPGATAAKVSAPGEKSTDPATAVAVSGTDCGLPVASSVKAIDSLFAPVDSGRKPTVTVQTAPAARLEGAVGQVLAVSTKSCPTAIDEIFKATV